MNLIKALLIRTILSFKFNSEFTLLKCKIPQFENNIKMFTHSSLTARIINIEDNYQLIDNALISGTKCVFMQKTQFFYILLEEKVSQQILEAMKYKQQQSYLILEFNFKENIYNLRLCFKLIKVSNQTSKNNIELISKGDQVKIQNIKNVFFKYRLKNLEFIEKHKSLVDAEFLERHVKFKPLYYSTHLECFEALKSFLKPLNFLKIVENYDSGCKIERNTVVTPHVLNRLHKKFKKDFKNFDNGKNYAELYNIFKDKVDIHLLAWMNSDLLVPIESKKDTKHFVENTYSILHRLFVKLQKNPNWLKNIEYPYLTLIYVIFDNLRYYAANELFKLIENDITRPRNLSEFYSNVYNNKEECSVLALEKIVCDYTNLMESILNVNLDHKPYHNHCLNYISPLKDCGYESL